MKKLLFIFLFSITATAQVVVPPTPAKNEINSLNLNNNKIYNANLINTYPERLPTSAINLITATEKGRTVFDTTTNEVKYFTGTAWKVYAGLNSFSATSPLSYNNTNGIFSIAQSGSATNGFLSSVDWNIFNNKQNVLSNANATTNGILTSTDWTTFNNKQSLLTATLPLSIIANNIGIRTANTTTNGVLLSTDWNTFNNKQNAISATAPLSFNSGTATMSIPQSGLVTSGFLSNTDFINFSNKLQTANNGLTATGTLVELGGTLSKNTNINQNGFNLTTSGTGNFGIGTTTPTAKLEIAGQVKITGGTPALGKVLTSDAVGLATWQPIVVPTFDATINFSVNANPNTAGTTFTPNTPNSTTVIYVSSIDGSQWTYNGTAYITAPVSADWKVTGNSGTVQANNFIGTTDNVGLNFRTNNVIRQTITNTGNVGIGTTTPATRLHIQGNSNTDAILIISNPTASSGGIYFGNSGHGLIRGYPTLGADNNVGLYTTAGDVFLSGNGTLTNQFVVKNNGNIGIGTTTPTAKLEINNGTAGSGLKFTQLNASSTPVTGAAPLGVDATGNVVTTPGSIFISVDGATNQSIGAAFTTIIMGNIVTASGVPASNYNTATGIFTVPVTGTYEITGSLRYADGQTAGRQFGVGVHTSNGDGSWFLWHAIQGTTSGANRTTYPYIRVAKFNAGEQLRMFSYVDQGTMPIGVSGMQIRFLF
jgi:hypothetical protein